MFTKEDYANYFNELEEIFRKSLVIYTDLLNDISDAAIRSKLFMLASEDNDAFNFITETKAKYF
jgi:formiminotetrahydrofolate cyclodeaminase